MRWTSEPLKKGSLTAGTKNGKGNLYSASIWILVPMMVLTFGIDLHESLPRDEETMADIGWMTIGGPVTVLVNEVYPEPTLDLNGDGAVNTLDEFVELYNPSSQGVDLSNWSLSDNYDTFMIGSLSLAPGAFVTLWRNETLLKLGRDDMAVLRNGTGAIVDSMGWDSLQTGCGLQRSPDGSDLIRRVFDPTPGSKNAAIPRVLINEVMIDPDGANLGNQWVELLNIGNQENLRGFVLSNGENVVVNFDEQRVAEMGRLVVFLGAPSDDVVVPDGIAMIFSQQSSALYTNGDGLTLKDNDGRVVDHLSWGSSSHVGDPGAGYEETTWSGKYWDAWNGSMSASGEENPVPATGRSLLRIPDGRDTSSPGDWIVAAGNSTHTMGWDNAKDPSLFIETGPQPLHVEKGGQAELSVLVRNTGGLQGAIDISMHHDSRNWTFETGPTGEAVLYPGGTVRYEITAQAPEVFTQDRYVRMWITATWKELAPVSSTAFVDLMVPAADVLLEGVELEMDGKRVSSVPSGSLLSLCGSIRGQAELDPGNVSLELRIFDLDRPGSDPLITSALSFFGMTSRSRREFDITIDTLGLDGRYMLDLAADRGGLIEESDEENNKWSTCLEVVPPVIGEGQLGLRISEVLWNCSPEETRILVENPGGSIVDLSGVRISDGGKYMSFPAGAVLHPYTCIAVFWDPEGMSRVGEANQAYCPYGVDAQNRMVVLGPLPDIYGKGKVVLSTEYRMAIDMVVLRNGPCLQTGWNDEEALETTWGSVLFRRRSSEGDPIDSNTSLDWKVMEGSCRLIGFLPDPAVYGVGELVFISAGEGTVDLSGFLLHCSNRGAVIPNGTFVEEGEVLVVSKDPEGYLNVHGEVPDLCFGKNTKIDGIEIKGCGIPEMQELVLPNSGGRLILLDRGNRIMDSVAWGSEDPDSIGVPSRDMIIGRSPNPDGSREGWMVVGTGSDPVLPWNPGRNCSSSFLIPRSLFEGLEWVLQEGDVTIVTPLLDDERIVSMLAEHMERGHSVEIIYTFAPWSELEETEEKLHPAQVRAGLAKFLQKEGARLRMLGSGKGEAGTSLLLTETRMLSVLGPLGISWDDRSEIDIRCLGIAFGNDSRAGTLDNIRLRYRSGAATDLVGLALVQPVEPATGPPITGPSHLQDCIAIGGLRAGSMQAVEDKFPVPGRVSILHADGPIDMVSLLEYARSGMEVSLLLGPGFLEVLGAGATEELNRTVERILRGESLLSITELSNDVLLRTAALLKAAVMEGLPMEARICRAVSRHSSRGSVMVIGDEVRTSLPKAAFDGGFCSISFSGEAGYFRQENFDTEWTGSAPFPWGLLPGEFVLETESPAPMIEEVYYDTYLPDDPDEFVCLYNPEGSVLDLAGYMLTDDEGLGISSDGIVLLGDLQLHPGKEIFITMNGSGFVGQNGELPCVEWGSGGPYKAVSCHGLMRLANSNDTLTLRDQNGCIVDSVVWGSASLPTGTWTSYEGGTWTGPAVPDVGWGKVLRREGCIDTNTKEDWASLRPRFPGQSRMDLFGKGNFSSMSVGVCPDSSSEVLATALDSARRSVELNVYEMTSDWITSRLIGLYQRGVEVEVLLEGDPVGGISYLEEVCISRMAAAGIEVRMMVTDPGMGIRDRYRYDHAKYIVIDGSTVLVSTDNLKDTSFPPPGAQVHSGTRGWVVSMLSADLAEDLSIVFREDWEGPDIHICQGSYDVDELRTFSTFTDVQRTVLDRSWHSPVTVDEWSTGEVLVSPDHISLPENPLMEAIRNAETEIVLELMDLDTGFLSSSVNEDMVPGSHAQDIGKYGVRVLNPYIGELIEAAGRGVDISILLDGSDFNGDLEPDCLERMEELRSIFARCGVLENIKVLMHPSPRYGLDHEIGMVHTKGMIIDERWVWLSSFNWGPTSGLENRELGILFDSPAAARYLKEVVLYDLGGSLWTDLDIRQEWACMERIDDDAVRIEAGFYVHWSGSGGMMLELHMIDGPGGTRTIVGSAPIEQDFEGRVVLNGFIDDGQEECVFLITVKYGDLSCDVSTFEVLEPVSRTEEDNMGLWGQGWVPILLIALIALSISLARAFLSRRHYGAEE
ncbi:MAG: lamin tail domain-containing protein [Thermoplasmatota archaeon]